VVVSRADLASYMSTYLHTVLWLNWFHLSFCCSHLYRKQCIFSLVLDITLHIAY